MKDWFCSTSYSTVSRSGRIGGWDQERAQTILDLRDETLLEGLGYEIEAYDNLTKILRSEGRRYAFAMLLLEDWSPEASSARFNNLSPATYALKTADLESGPWVIMVKGNRLRLYSTSPDTGVGRRGRTETYI